MMGLAINIALELSIFFNDKLNLWDKISYYKVYFTFVTAVY